MESQVGSWRRTGRRGPAAVGGAVLRIGELARQLGLNPRTIRYYESIGLLPEPERTASGYRLYGEADRDRLVFIKTAQRLGITLDEIREILALRDRDEQPCAYVRSVIARQLAEIDQRLAELRRLRGELAALEARAEGLPDTGGVCRLIDHVERAAGDPRLAAPARRGRLAGRR